MDLTNAVIMGVVPSERREGYDSKHFHAKIVLLDQAEEGIRPLLYQLDKEKIDADLTHVEAGYVGLPKGGFLLVGSVVKVDRENKLIYITNDPQNLAGEYAQHTISYEHLINAKGITHNPNSHQQDEEFSTALQALIDAMKIRSTVPESMTEIKSEPKKKNLSLLHKILERSKEKEKLSNILESCLRDHQDDYFPPLSTKGKCRFEIQL